MVVCPSCEQPLSPGPAVRFCPSCGFSIEGQTGRPGWVLANIDLRLVARKQRQIIGVILIKVVLYLDLMFGGISGPSALLTLLLGVGFVACIAVSAVQFFQLMGGLRMSMIVRIVVAPLLLAPCISLLVLLIVNSRATSALQAAGLTFGFLGVSDEQVTRMLGAYACRSCGYNLFGNTSGVCTECGVPR